MTWTVKVEGEGEDLTIEIPDELMDAMGWSVGDDLKFEMINNQVVISKVVDPTDTVRALDGVNETSNTE